MNLPKQYGPAVICVSARVISHASVPSYPNEARCPRCGSSSLVLELRDAYADAAGNPPPRSSYGSWIVCTECGTEWPEEDDPASPPVALAGPADPAVAPRAHRDPREVERKRQLLHEPHSAPLADFVRRLDAKHGSVPWFDPTEAGVNARILLLFENPGRRADAAQGSGFISADNDDPSAQNMSS